MFSQQETELFDCFDFDIDNYYISIFPSIDIAYLSNSMSCNPIFQTDWITVDKVDIKQVTNGYISIPNDKKQSSIKDLLQIMDHIKYLLFKLASIEKNIKVIIPLTIMNIIQDKDKITFPYKKLLNVDKIYDDPIRIRFKMLFTGNIVKGRCKIKVNILDLDIEESLHKTILMDNIDNLDMMVTI